MIIQSAENGYLYFDIAQNHAFLRLFMEALHFIRCICIDRYNSLCRTLFIF